MIFFKFILYVLFINLVFFIYIYLHIFIFQLIPRSPQPKRFAVELLLLFVAYFVGLRHTHALTWMYVSVRLHNGLYVCMFTFLVVAVAVAAVTAGPLFLPIIFMLWLQGFASSHLWQVVCAWVCVCRWHTSAIPFSYSQQPNSMAEVWHLNPAKMLV